MRRRSRRRSTRERSLSSAPASILEVIAKTEELGKVSIPGALTPTEVITAWRAGADYVKIFPCSAMGGAQLSEVAAGAISGAEADSDGRRHAANRGRFSEGRRACTGCRHRPGESESHRRRHAGEGHRNRASVSGNRSEVSRLSELSFSFMLPRLDTTDRHGQEEGSEEDEAENRAELRAGRRAKLCRERRVSRPADRQTTASNWIRSGLRSCSAASAPPIPTPNARSITAMHGSCS